MDQSQRLILAELEDRVEQLFASLESLREVLGEGKKTREILDSVFRDVHSLKATAASNGFDNTSSIAHQFENLLHSLRTGKARLDENLLQACDQTADALLLSLQESSRNQDLAGLFKRLNQLTNTAERRQRLEVELILNALPVEIWQSLGEAEKHRLEEAVGEGASLYLVTASFDVSNFDEQFQTLKDKLSEAGELISTAPKVSHERPDKIDFRILYTREANLEQVIEELLGIPGVAVSEVAGSSTTSEQAQRKSESLPPPVVAQQPANLIRINLDDLDHIISSTHKLLRKTTSSFAEALAKTQDVAFETELKTRAADLHESFMGLAADLVNLRMISIDRVLQRALRAGRSAALAAGKEIDFTIRGRDLLLDKSLSDAITDPLIHLVRNAVDHGIEDAEVRAQQGKKRRGNVHIEASTLQGQTRITVRDDGRGIDPKIVATAATRLGVLQEGEEIGLEQSIRLLFLTGLSTAKEVSRTSGRGIGLDVVESAIESVGGSVRVHSELRKGSSFEVRLPVTFGLLDVVLASAAGQSYLIDASHIVSTQPLELARVEASDSGAMLAYEGHSIPLLRLSDLVGQKRTAVNEGQGSILICRVAKHGSDETSSSAYFALLADQIEELQRLLIRNLGSRGGRWFGVAGASELQDGKVVLLLDLPRLMFAAMRH